jgi:3-hydroxyisobutyrate dehydrogenase
MKIGFIGTGVMGAAMAGHLLDAGNEVYVYNRTKAKTDDLVSRGATWRDTPHEVAEATDFVITIVGYPTDVKEVYDDIFQADVTGKILIDMTTSTPALAKEIGERAVVAGAQALDAPVSGGDVGAKNATLTIMVGGPEGAYDKALPIFEILGKTTARHGENGAGQHCKMANQIMIAGTMLGMSEFMVYADAAGLNLEKVIETLSGGGANNWSMANYAPRILNKDFAPGFFVKHFVKDLKIALDEASAMNLDLPMTALAEKLYEKLADQDLGTQSLIKAYSDKF